jgi:hypothetical protein
MSLNRPIVLILTSDSVFSREITEHWPQEPAPHSGAPDFIVLDEGFAHDLNGSNYDLAIADMSNPRQRGHLAANAISTVNKNMDMATGEGKGTNKDQSPWVEVLRQSLAAAGKPAIMIHSDPAWHFHDGIPTNPVLELPREPQFWPAFAGLIGREILGRRQAQAYAHDAEASCTAAQAHATLGRYMIEMRININNALTAVLGNAELLALEPGLPGKVQAQADTIRNMALRLHEIFRRFSSIEKELTVDARETSKKATHTAAGKH